MTPTQTLRVSISNPCIQNWDALPNVGTGKYCGSCQKVVTDFSSMSDGMMLAYLQKNGFGCGLFRADQLDRPLIPAQQSSHTHGYKWMAALFVLFGLSRETKAQVKAPIAQSPSGNSTSSSATATKMDTAGTKAPLVEAADLGTSSYQPKNGQMLYGGARTCGTTYVIDGLVIAPNAQPITSKPEKSFWRKIQFWRK